MNTRPLLLIHGIRLNRGAWTGVRTELPEGQRVTAIDLPGHGRLRGERFSYSSAREVICRAIDDLGEPTVLVGHSLGGYVAMAVAAREPERVAGLVIAGSTCRPTPGATAPFLWMHGLLRSFRDGGEALSAWMLRAVLPEPTASAVIRRGIASEVLPDVVAELRASQPLDDLAAFSGPVRLVNGRFDHLRAEETRFVAAAACADLRVVPGAGHYLPMTKPHVFAREVLDFLRVEQRHASQAP